MKDCYIVTIKYQERIVLQWKWRTMREAGEALGDVVKHFEAGYDSTALIITIERFKE